MLEAQKDRMHHRSRLRAKGMTEDEIAAAQQRPFRPAFVDGKRRSRETEASDEEPVPQFAFRRHR
jgi:hypothetical protein